MNPVVRIARRVALGLLDGEWSCEALGARLVDLGGLEEDEEDEEDEEEVEHGPRWWAFHLAQDCARLERPSLYILTTWLLRHAAFAELLATGWRPVVRWSVPPAPEMREGRWDVPALATHRELASSRAGSGSVERS